LSSSPEKVYDPVTKTTKHTSEQNRLLSALEAFYCCVVLLGGGDNNMNKQELGLDPYFPPKPQTPEEIATAAAKKVQRAAQKVQGKNSMQTLELSGKYMGYRQQQTQKYAEQRRVQVQLEQEARYKEQLLHLERRPERQLWSALRAAPAAAAAAAAPDAK
jgi:hypothetical protein